MLTLTLGWLGEAFIGSGRDWCAMVGWVGLSVCVCSPGVILLGNEEGGGRSMCGVFAQKWY